MVLGEHGRHRVVLRGKFEQVEIIRLRVANARGEAGGDVDVGKFVEIGIGIQLVVLEGQGLAIIQLLLKVRLGGITVEGGIDDVHPLGGESDIQGVGGGAHRKDKAAAFNIIANGAGHRLFHFRDVGIAQLGGHCLINPHLLQVPGCIAEGAVKFAVLPGKILVVQVQPVVVAQLVVEHFFIINLIVGHFRIGQRHGHRIVPGLFVERGVDGDLRRLLQQHPFHILRFDGGINCIDLPRPDQFILDPANPAFGLQSRKHRHQEGAAAIVEQPFHVDAPGKRHERHPIGLEMVGLHKIHRDQQMLRLQGKGQQQPQAEKILKTSFHGIRSGYCWRIAFRRSREGMVNWLWSNSARMRS